VNDVAEMSTRNFEKNSVTAMNRLIHLSRTYPENQIKNTRSSIDFLIGDPPQSVKDELKIYIRTCLIYTFSAREEIIEISRLVDVQEMIFIEVDLIRNEIDSACRNAGV
jgi:hypothetical protein